MLNKLVPDGVDPLFEGIVHGLQKDAPPPPVETADGTIAFSGETPEEIKCIQTEHTDPSEDGRQINCAEPLQEKERIKKEADIYDRAAITARQNGDFQLAQQFQKAATEKLQTAINFTGSSYPSLPSRWGPVDIYADMSEAQLKEFQNAGGQTAQDFAIAYVDYRTQGDQLLTEQPEMYEFIHKYFYGGREFIDPIRKNPVSEDAVGARVSKAQPNFTGLTEKAELNASASSWTPLGCRSACRVLPGDVTASNSQNR